MKNIFKMISVVLILALMLPSVSAFAFNDAREWYDSPERVAAVGYSDAKKTTVSKVKYTYGQEDKIKYYITEKTKTAEVGCNFQLRMYSNFGATKDTTLVCSETSEHKRIADIVSWSSSNPAVATVDVTGYVEPLSVGTTTIKASVKDGGKTKSVKCKLTVEYVPVTVGDVEDIVISAWEDYYSTIDGTLVTKDVFLDETNPHWWFPSERADIVKYKEYMEEHRNDVLTLESFLMNYGIISDFWGDDGRHGSFVPNGFFSSDYAEYKERDFAQYEGYGFPDVYVDLDECSDRECLIAVVYAIANGYAVGNLVSRDNIPSWSEYAKAYVPDSDYFINGQSYGDNKEYFIDGQYIGDYNGRVSAIYRSPKADGNKFVSMYKDAFKREIKPQQPISLGYAKLIIERARGNAPTRIWQMSCYFSWWELENGRIVGYEVPMLLHEGSHGDKGEPTPSKYFEGSFDYLGNNAYQTLEEQFGWSWARGLDKKKYFRLLPYYEGLSRAFLRDSYISKAEWEAMNDLDLYRLDTDGSRIHEWNYLADMDLLKDF